MFEAQGWWHFGLMSPLTRHSHGRTLARHPNMEARHARIKAGASNAMFHCEGSIGKPWVNGGF
jgi:hypothetical protein